MCRLDCFFPISPSTSFSFCGTICRQISPSANFNADLTWRVLNHTFLPPPPARELLRTELKILSAAEALCKQLPVCLQRRMFLLHGDGEASRLCYDLRCRTVRNQVDGGKQSKHTWHRPRCKWAEASGERDWRYVMLETLWSHHTLFFSFQSIKPYMYSTFHKYNASQGASVLHVWVYLLMTQLASLFILFFSFFWYG